MKPVVSPFGANSSLTTPRGPTSCSAHTIQQREEHQRHRQRHVEVGVGAAEQRLLDHEAVRGLVAPADRADAGNQADPVGGEDEDEDRGEEPERLLHQVRADDALEQPVDAFDEPLEQVLRAARDLRHLAASPPARTRSGRRATIHVTTMELVIGKPNGAAISTAFCDSPCSAGAWAARRRSTSPRPQTRSHAEASRRARKEVTTWFVRPTAIARVVPQGRVMSGRPPAWAAAVAACERARPAISGIPGALRDAGGVRAPESSLGRVEESCACGSCIP